ncbi:MAG: transglycosylase SLT domain-containing protein [Beijerinckiaceae bacterium]|nr:transglycosylase SLT domain-containing protein [Beijerinckiaceae bacterium]MCZ8301948.1 transglycosylase SLT domain-containing protein [Beijerinckiaceae bacterium]
MFFFTTPNRTESVPQVQGEHPLSRPLRQASEATGIPFDYLVKTAKRESNLNPEAKAASSSATGLFQFIEQTWLGLVKREGPNLGLAEAASAIQRDGSGRYVVPEGDMRQQILALRKDPTLSARLAGVFTSENRSSLREALGRDPTGGELYIAHFMGAGGAKELIGLANGSPERSAASAFPEAASANRSIFFDPKGRARTTREVYARLVSFHDGATSTMPPAIQQAGMPAEPEMATRSPLAIAPARVATVTGVPQPSPAAVGGFFRTGANSQAGADLRKTWTTVAESRMNPNAPSFFPRADPVKVAAAEAAIIEAVDKRLSDIEPPSPLAGFEAMARPTEPSVAYPAVRAPLPPMRPAHLGGTGPLDLTPPPSSPKR